MPSCAQRLTVFGDTWRSSATCAVRRYVGSVVWGNALSRSCCRPRLGDDFMPVGVGCHRGFYTGLVILGCVPMQLGSHPVNSWTLTSWPWSFARHLPQWLPDKQLPCSTIILLLGMPGRPVVTSSGRGRYCAPGRGFRSASQPIGPACPLPPAPASGRRRSIPPRRWREGQKHDGWNREVVQRRQGLRLHRP
jgi:hypothetical protein